MVKMALIYFVALFLLSAQANMLKDNDITDNQIHNDYKPAPNPTGVHRKRQAENNGRDVSPADTSKADNIETARKKNEIEITDTPTPNLHKRQTEEKENASLSDSSTANSSTEETKIDNGTALILTPYIEQSNIEEARRLSQVDSDLFLDIKSYSGYLTVNETYNSNLFFWYFPGERNEDTPWIVWLQGGPGQSSMMGLFYEMGPFSIEDSAGALNLNQLSWLQNHSLVFIDNPVGTGFSFTDNEDGYAQSMDTYGSHLYSAVHQLVQLFPELQTAPLFVAGESYGGKYAPALATQIHNRKDERPKKNLQGIIIGNGFADPYQLRDLTRAYYSYGLLAPEQVEELQPLVQKMQEIIDADVKDSAQGVKTYSDILRKIAGFTGSTSIPWVYLYEESDYTNNEVKTTKFLEKSETRRAIHVGNKNFTIDSEFIFNKLGNADFLSSANSLYESLLENYDVFAYCGELDLLLPCMVESENFRRWQWNGSDSFRKSERSVYVYNNTLSGYYKTGGRFTEAVIVMASRMAPMDRPGALQQLVSKWTRDRNLDESKIRLQVLLPEVDNTEKVTFQEIQETN